MRLDSSLTRGAWAELTGFDSGDPDSAAYDAACDALWDGLMSIGTIGCNGQLMLLMNGPDQDRVITIDQDLAFPSLAPQSNFIAWYESWLDRLLEALPPSKAPRA